MLKAIRTRLFIPLANKSVSSIPPRAFKLLTFVSKLNNDGYTKKYLLVVLITVLPILAIYLPFVLKLDQLFFLPIEQPGFFNIIRNWDGPNYIVVGKTFYDTTEIPKYLINELPLEYYVAHLPLYPITILLFAPFLGWLYSGVFVNIVFGVLLNVLFYTMSKKYTKHALFLTFLFTIFPARFYVVRTIIAPETLLVFLMLLSIWLFDMKKIWLSSIAGMLAVLTKVQAVFLFPAYAAVFAEKWLAPKIPLLQKRVKGLATDLPFWRWSYVSLLLIPGGLIVLSLFYYVQVGDFFAFLSAQKGNSLYFTFPFAHFNYTNPWALTGWLEDVVFYFIAMFILAFSLARTKQRSWFYFTLFYALFLVIVPQRDITRFSMQVAPLFFLHYHEFFTSRPVRWAILICFPAIYFYTLNFLLTNQAPVSDWTPFLQ